MRTPVLLTLACTGLLAASAQAQLVVGNDQSGSSSIYRIDVSTGIATPIYTATTNEAKPWGMAYDGVTNTLYWNNGSVLYSSPMGNPLVPVNLGGMTFAAGTINFVAMSFANGKLYGTRNIATEAVYEVDPVTRVATQVYVHPSVADFGGLDHDSTTGLLYGLSDTAITPDPRGLFLLDPVGMTTTFKAPYPAGETDIDGLAVHAGKAYYVSDGPNTTQANFYVFDIATATQTGTIPSPFTGSGTFSAATWAEPTNPSTPSTPICLGDGTGAPCPCSNNSTTPGNGCGTTGSPGGANLSTSGVASDETVSGPAADTLLLTATGLTGPALFFQADGSLGTANLGDGLLCANQNIVRMGVVFDVAGVASYPGGTTPQEIHLFGALAGQTKLYQAWYRSAPALCQPGVQNSDTTNGVSLTWGN